MKTDENLLNAIRAFRKCSTFSSVRAYIFKQKQAKKMEEKIEKWRWKLIYSMLRTMSVYGAHQKSE